MVDRQLLLDIDSYIAKNFVPIIEDNDYCDFEKFDNFEVESLESMPKKAMKARSIFEIGRKKECLESVGSRSLDDLVNHTNDTFSQMLLRLIDDRGLKDSEVYKKARIDRRHFSKIRNDVHYVPNKKTVEAFTIALGLSVNEADELMNSAGYAFSKSSKQDIIISYFLENKIYDMFTINEVLDKYNQPIF